MTAGGSSAIGDELQTRLIGSGMGLAIAWVPRWPDARRPSSRLPEITAGHIHAASQMWLSWTASRTPKHWRATLAYCVGALCAKQDFGVDNRMGGSTGSPVPPPILFGLFATQLRGSAPGSGGTTGGSWRSGAALRRWLFRSSSFSVNGCASPVQSVPVAGNCTVSR